MSLPRPLSMVRGVHDASVPLLRRLHPDHGRHGCSVALIVGLAVVPIASGRDPDADAGSLAVPSLSFSLDPDTPSPADPETDGPAMTDNMGGDRELLWPGFLYGMEGFDRMPSPVSQPLYFEDPFIRSDLRFLFLWHDFSEGSQLRGGHLSTYALQIRVALTERLAFIATKDGYSTVRADVLQEADGWNDFAIGLKYALACDSQPDEEWILTGGMRWEWQNGDEEVLSGDSQELSPFLSYAHRWDRFNFIGGLTYRMPMNDHRAVHSLMWDAHFSYEVWPNFYPLVEFHGLHYLSSGERIPFSIDGLDYSNIGGQVSGHSVYWAGVGFRWQLTDHLSAGATYEFPLMNPDRDIFENRVTVNISLGL